MAVYHRQVPDDHDHLRRVRRGNRVQYLASLNGAYVAIGLLYGDGDILRTIEYACRCGQDSDCNPSNAGAVVGAMLGYAALPSQWKTSIQQYPGNTYSYTNYTYGQLVTSTLNRARSTIVTMGGSVTADSCVILLQTPAPPPVWEAFGADPVPIDSAYVRAVIAATPVRGAAPLDVSFSAAGSLGRNLSFQWTFGDGGTASGASATHTYTAIGTCQVRLTASNTGRADTAYATIVVLDPSQTSLKNLGTPIVSVTSPSGAGSRDLNTIRDNVYPTSGSYDVAYDTYNGSQHAEDYFGYTFTSTYAFTQLVHRYGPRDPDPEGGVFETFRVQVRVGAVWTDVTGATVVPSGYSASAARSFDSLVITFPATAGNGIRIIGAPRGGEWVGCAELDVYGTPVSSVCRAQAAVVRRQPVARAFFAVDGRRVSGDPYRPVGVYVVRECVGARTRVVVAPTGWATR